MSSQRGAEYCDGMVRSWHLAILRFAVTRDNADRLGVLAIANEIDGLGRQHQDKPHFDFFRRTSLELCAAILRQDSAAEAVLRGYLMQIDDARLKRALATALGIGRATPEKKLAKADLWRGLPT